MNGVGITLTLVGLAATALGAWIAARAVIITEQRAAKLAETHWDKSRPLEAAFIAQSEAARNGLYLVMVGTILQFTGTAAVALS